MFIVFSFIFIINVSAYNAMKSSYFPNVPLRKHQDAIFSSQNKASSYKLCRNEHDMVQTLHTTNTWNSLISTVFRYMKCVMSHVLAFFGDKTWSGSIPQHPTCVLYHSDTLWTVW